MTQQEKLTLEDLNRKFDAYLQQNAEDKEEARLWRESVDARLTPLVDSSKERAIIEKYAKTGFQVLMGILGLVAAVGIAYSQLQRVGR